MKRTKKRPDHSSVIRIARGTRTCLLMLFLFAAGACGDPDDGASATGTDNRPSDRLAQGEQGSQGQPGSANDLQELSAALTEVSFGRVWQSWSGDFDGIKERRFLRAVTPYGGYQFYYENGKPRGATWELLQRLQEYINENTRAGVDNINVVVLPVGRDQLIPALLDGHADLIAADLTDTETRSSELSFSRPLLENINEVLVTGPAAPEIGTIDDLAGKQIAVRASSSYYEHLVTLAAGFTDRGLDAPEIVEADELLEAEDLLEMVNVGLLPMTVMDDYKAEFWSSVYPDIVVRSDIVFNEGGSIAWAIRPDSPQLAATLDSFFRKYGKGTMVGNDTYNRYLADASDVRCANSAQALENLEQLVEVFQKYGEEYDFEWLMLAAQGFQESGLQQGRRSAAGAVGIMQIKPTTASDKNINVDDVTTIDGNVHAAAKYMRFIADRYFAGDEFDALSQWVFSLAAYNAGPARVAALRKEARESGLDPNRWFNNVEIVAARRIGQETVTYVGNVFKYYIGYQLTMNRSLERAARHEGTLDSCLTG